jgi:hypothetical protein
VVLEYPAIRGVCEKQYLRKAESQKRNLHEIKVRLALMDEPV